jgi:hypothetical protein
MVEQIMISGSEFTLYAGPMLPASIPGDSSTTAVTIRFCPTSDGPLTGTLTISSPSASNSPVVIGLSGSGIPSEPFEDTIVLGPSKELVFENYAGAFNLWGGDVLHCQWANGVLNLNGTPYRPGISPEDYRRSIDFTREQLQMYAEVPYIQERVARYGDTDIGWNRAYAEWESLTTRMTRAVAMNYDRNHSIPASQAFMLAEDSHHLLEWVRVLPGGLKYKWLGEPSPGIVFSLPAHLQMPHRTVISREDALQEVSVLRSLLSGTGRNRVTIRFGSFRNQPLTGEGE